MHMLIQLQEKHNPGNTAFLGMLDSLFHKYSCLVEDQEGNCYGQMHEHGIKFQGYYGTIQHNDALG